ncbi:unnamed protein product [Nippostrongylus brasiliensis]|uniref:Acyltransferase n=1 Tax=Nippostrongylus brasiliensis TaxID=27835 RepID=A0A0N4Y9E1_NIPBR|nr:unnamed protein product [Nippostrongylus brasiliensis]
MPFHRLIVALEEKFSGPYPILLFGNLPQIMYYGIKYGGIAPALREFKKKYGPVFTLWLGPLPSVRIADYKLSQEAMVQRGTIYNDRWVPPPMNIGRGNQAG